MKVDDRIGADHNRSSPAPARHGTPFLASLNCDGARGLWMMGLCALLVVPELGGDALRLALRYERTALADGEWWRLASAHVVHLDLEHAVLNALGLALLWALFAAEFTGRRWLAIVAASIAGVDAGLWFLEPALGWYVGASGALHGVLAAGALARLRRHRMEGAALAVLLIGKLAWEQTQGALPLTISGPVVVDAHLYGALGGFAAALVLCFRREPL